ncbi:MAG TPA: GAF domain-containing protein, partial [Anaerolineales bacterium]
TLLSGLVVAATSKSHGFVIILSVLSVLSLLEAVALLLALRGNLTLAKVIVPIALVVAITIIALSADSMHSISIVAYPLAIIIAALLQGRRSLVITTPLAVLAIALLGIMDMAGLSTSAMKNYTDLEDILTGMVLLGASAGILHLLIERLRTARAAAEANEQAQLESNRELTNLKMSLEERVQHRTNELHQRSSELEAANRQARRKAAQLEALAQVAHAIASVRDLRELLPQIATAISEQFGFYHVGVFLLDEANEYAVLSAANSEGGQKMLERKHRLRVGEEGIVGHVTLTGEPRVAVDVGKDPVFFDNPDLPDTHSELALPLRTKRQIVGALDVQSTERGAFTEEDIRMLSLLAEQVSLAIENARLFDETRSALAEAEAISRQFTREAWGRVPVEHKLLGYRYSVAGAAPLSEPLDVSAIVGPKSRDSQKEKNQVAIPIQLRGETIGTLIVQSPSTDRLNQEQIDMIKAVADRVALSAENARLFEETTRRAERERLVSDITGKIRSVNDPQAMVQTAVEELRKALGASRVEVIPQSVQGAE